MPGEIQSGISFHVVFRTACIYASVAWVYSPGQFRGFECATSVTPSVKMLTERGGREYRGVHRQVIRRREDARRLRSRYVSNPAATLKFAERDDDEDEARNYWRLLRFQRIVFKRHGMWSLAGNLRCENRLQRFACTRNRNSWEGIDSFLEFLPLKLKSEWDTCLKKSSLFIT